ncbi:MAG: hypothetical protein ACLSX2_02350, partial [Christensenellaceae bacterium]
GRRVHLESIEHSRASDLSLAHFIPAGAPLLLHCREKPRQFIVNAGAFKRAAAACPLETVILI